MRYLLPLLFAAVPLFSTPLLLETLTAEIPPMQRTAYTPATESVTFVGKLFPATQTPLTAQSQYPDGDLFRLFAQLLVCYAKGDLQGSTTLYATDSQPAIKAFIKDIGEERILEVSQKITSLSPRIIWIDSPGTAICYAKTNHDNYLPFMLTREGGEWKLMAGRMDSRFSNIADYIGMYHLWDELKLTKTPANQPVDAAAALESASFDNFPVLSPPPDISPAAPN